MKMQPVPVRMDFFRIVTTYRPAVKERDELRSIVRGRPLRKVLHLNANDFVEFQVTLNRRDFGVRRQYRRRGTRRGCRRGSGRRSLREDDARVYEQAAKQQHAERYDGSMKL